MGFFGRKKPAPSTWPPAGPITTWPPEPLRLTTTVAAWEFDPPRQPLEVVGEGSFQGTLERVAQGRNEDGANVRDHAAVLMPEPTNPYDPNAVRVVIPSGGTIGYLSREDALAYRPVIDRLAAVGKLVAC